MTGLNRRIRCTGAVLLMAVLAIALGAAKASAAPVAPEAPEVYTCFVRTIGVPFYNKPYPSGGEIKGWVTEGQGFDVYAEDFGGHWRGGNLWGGPSGVWIHANYLVC